MKLTKEEKRINYLFQFYDTQGYFPFDKKKVKKGNCIEIACKNIIDKKDWVFCYAYIMGQGKIKGQRILHAWNEHKDLVFDFSNGKVIVMEREKYYKIAKIKERVITKQTPDEVRRLMLEHQTYGGWIK